MCVATINPNFGDIGWP